MPSPLPAAAILLTALLLLPFAVTASGKVGASEPEDAEVAVGPGETFVFAPCNRDYVRDGAELAPITRGPVTLRLSSPRNRLTLEEHELRLTPRSDGTHRAVVRARVAGTGDLVIDVDAGGNVTRLEDRVEVPRQERTVEARVRLERRQAAEGEAAPLYTLTTVELPETVRIDVESALIGRFADLCQSMALFLALDCTALRDALSRVRVDLPAPGETYLLPPECIDGDLRRRLDAYLDRAAGAPGD